MALKPPQYPYEALTRPSKNRKVVNIPHKGVLRSHRMLGYAHPPVVSSTQQLLCLTPSKSGIISLKRELAARNSRNKPGSAREMSKYSDVGADISVKRFNESRSIADKNSIISRNKILEKSDIFRTIRNRTNFNMTSSTPNDEASASHFSPLYTSLVKMEKNSRPEVAPKSATNQWDFKIKNKSSQYYERPTLHSSHTRTAMSTPRKSDVINEKAKWPVFQLTNNVQRYKVNFTEEHHTSLNQTRKMAPVLRVLPALPASRLQYQSYDTLKSHNEDNKKRVRFMDQIGQPLTRNATPNYKRKHSYILRWLETAGKPPKNLQML